MMRVIYKKNVEAAESMEGCILKTLTYFSIFEYPLTKEELKRFLSPAADPGSFDNALARLTEEKIIFKIEDLYLLQDNRELVKRRRDGNLRAERLLVKAMKIGKFLSRFPYVRGIAISGSLSKRYAGEKADIDFFIITKANRLWIARTFMHLMAVLLSQRRLLYHRQHRTGRDRSPGRRGRAPSRRSSRRLPARCFPGRRKRSLPPCGRRHR